MPDFPRTLFVTPLAFNHFTGGGVTFTNLFRGWPKDRLFTVHQDTLPLSHDVCTHYFKLGPEEMPLAWPFESLRRRVAGGAASAAVVEPAAVATDVASGARDPLRRFAFMTARAVFGQSGLPVSARLSSRLIDFIEKVRPEVIYTILGSIEMMELVEAIRVRFDLPVVVHLMDDWRNERERYGLLSPWRHRRLNRLFDHSMRTAKGHLAICDAMADAYSAEFGVPFAAIQNVIDGEEWLDRARQDVTPGSPVRMLYAGSLYPHVQLESLIDVAAAVTRLRADGFDIVLDVMCPEFMIAPFRARFEAFDGVRVVAQVARDRYFDTIVAADILLLPVNFDAAAIRMVRYSMPTKVPEYLVSGVPVFLYGVDDIAQIAYARREGWGHAVTRRDPALLARELRRVAEDNGLRGALVARARKTAATRHAAATVRATFRAVLARAAGAADERNRVREAG